MKQRFDWLVLWVHDKLRTSALNCINVEEYVTRTYLFIFSVYVVLPWLVNVILILINFMVTGVPYAMLCFSGIGCWGLPSHSMEYRWPPHNNGLHGKHGVASLSSSLSRGTHQLYRLINLSSCLPWASFSCAILWSCGYWIWTYLFVILVKQQKRVALLMAAALFEGASIGPLIELGINFDPRCVSFFLIVVFSIWKYCSCSLVC